MRIVAELDRYNWTIGVAICRSKFNGRLCFFITFLCLGVLFQPFESSKK